jgi:hypothetical protein
LPRRVWGNDSSQKKNRIGRLTPNPTGRIEKTNTVNSLSAKMGVVRKYLGVVFPTPSLKHKLAIFLAYCEPKLCQMCVNIQ